MVLSIPPRMALVEDKAILCLAFLLQNKVVVLQAIFKVQVIIERECLINLQMGLEEREHLLVSIAFSIGNGRRRGHNSSPSFFSSGWKRVLRIPPVPSSRAKREPTSYIEVTVKAATNAVVSRSFSFGKQKTVL